MTQERPGANASTELIKTLRGTVHTLTEPGPGPLIECYGSSGAAGLKFGKDRESPQLYYKCGAHVSS